MSTREPLPIQYLGIPGSAHECVKAMVTILRSSRTMAYTEKARMLRRCRASTRSGQPCRNYAVWSDTLHRCGTHGGRVAGSHTREKTAYVPCICAAYPFPHRPGSGLCKWPDVPTRHLKLRPGSHTPGRRELRGFLGQQPSAIACWRTFGKGQQGYRKRQ